MPVLQKGEGMTTEAHPRAAKATVPATLRQSKKSGFWADNGWALASIAIGLSIWEIISRFLIGNKLFLAAPVSGRGRLR